MNFRERHERKIRILKSCWKATWTALLIAIAATAWLWPGSTSALLFCCTMEFLAGIVVLGVIDMSMPDPLPPEIVLATETPKNKQPSPEVIIHNPQNRFDGLDSVVEWPDGSRFSEQ